MKHADALVILLHHQMFQRCWEIFYNVGDMIFLKLFLLCMFLQYIRIFKKTFQKQTFNDKPMDDTKKKHSVRATKCYKETAFYSLHKQADTTMLLD